MTNKQLKFNELNIDGLMERAKALPCTGKLAAAPNQFTYLDIHNGFIHQLFPLIKAHEEKVLKPTYFGPNLTGAHVSVIYPDETTFVEASDLDQEHSFTIKQAGVYSAELEGKRYYVLKIDAPSLIGLRLHYGLSSQLCFKDHWCDLHITIATAHLLGKRKS